MLGLNAAFHTHALAHATRPADWAVSKAELDSAVTGLPWHPAVYLAQCGSRANALPGHAMPAPPPPPERRHVLDEL